MKGQSFRRASERVGRSDSRESQNTKKPVPFDNTRADSASDSGAKVAKPSASLRAERERLHRARRLVRRARDSQQSSHTKTRYSELS